MTTDVTMPLVCLVCGRALEPAMRDDPSMNQPLSANTFASPGHYGACFDPGDQGRRLEVNVCQRCLHEAAEAGRVALVERNRGSVVVAGQRYVATGATRRRWQPDHRHDDEVSE